MRFTTRAADCSPRRSPPAFPPATIAATSRSANEPFVDWNVPAIASTVGLPTRMFPCAAKPRPTTISPLPPQAVPVFPPAQSKHSVPVHDAALPRMSIMPACRDCRALSVAIRMRSASSAVAPLRMSVKPRGPNEVFANDCVATAPTPASAHGTTGRTFGNFDCTATPTSPFTVSMATMENVATSGDRSLFPDTARTNARIQTNVGATIERGAM